MPRWFSFTLFCNRWCNCSSFCKARHEIECSKAGRRAHASSAFPNSQVNAPTTYPRAESKDFEVGYASSVRLLLLSLNLRMTRRWSQVLSRNRQQHLATAYRRKESNMMHVFHVAILVSTVPSDLLDNLKNCIKNLTNNNPPTCASHVDLNKRNYSVISLGKE